MPKPHHEIPSQRLARTATTVPAAAAKPQRSIWWAVGISLVGLAVVAYPAILLALLSYLLIAGSFGDAPTTSSITIGLLGMAWVLCMIATPILLGFAVTKRRRGLWIGAIVGVVLSLASLIYLLSAWMIPLG